MTYPSSVEIVTLTFGRSIRTDGTEVPSTITVTPVFTGTKTATWTATGTSLLPLTQVYKAEEGVMGSIQLPVVDQPGWVDDAQNPYTGWTYKLLEAIPGVNQNRVKYFSPVMGQTVVDFDLIPTGAVGTPTLGVIPAVTSVNGESGAVTLPMVSVDVDEDGYYVLTFHE